MILKEIYVISFGLADKNREKLRNVNQNRYIKKNININRSNGVTPV